LQLKTESNHTGSRTPQLDERSPTRTLG